MDFDPEVINEEFTKTFQIDEASNYTVYHDSYSSAVQTAAKEAKKRGYEVDEDDWSNKIATGPRKPSEGKTNSFSIELLKSGKPSKKLLHMQVYNTGNKYELNMYIESVQLDELSSETLASYKKKAGEDARKADAAGDYKKGNKRFSGVVKATKKEFDKSVKEEVVTESEDEDAGDAHIIMLLRKSVSLRGMKPVKFNDGKQVKVSASDAQKALSMFGAAKTPAEKTALQKKLAASYESLQKTINEEVELDEASNIIKTGTKVTVISGPHKGKTGRISYSSTTSSGSKYGIETYPLGTGHNLSDVPHDQIKIGVDESLEEKTLTPAELKKKEEIVKKLKTKDMDNDGDKDDSDEAIAHATATKIAKRVAEDVELDEALNLSVLKGMMSPELLTLLEILKRTKDFSAGHTREHDIQLYLDRMTKENGKAFAQKLLAAAKEIMTNSGVKTGSIMALEDVQIVDEAVLNIQQRLQRARQMRKNAPKLARKREMMSHRMADASHIEGRARKAAINALRKRLAGEKGAHYAELSASEKMAIDKKVEEKKGLIEKIAKRLVAKIRKKEQERVAAMHQQTQESVINPITEKSEKSGISFDVLFEVYARGVEEYNKNELETLYPGTDEQYAFDAVNSFISGGTARKLNEDLMKH